MNPHFPHAFFGLDHAYRHHPAEFDVDRKKWFQDGRKLRNVKTSKAFVWPKDGRNGGSWGRFKDILKDQGPDMYLTINADKLDYMYNRPTRARWSGHTNLDDTGLNLSLNSAKYAPWTNKGLLGGRMQGLSYDFRTRQYGVPNRRTWTDATWQPEPRINKYNPYPEAFRNIYGEWYQDPHYLPHNFGGPVNNERGRMP